MTDHNRELSLVSILDCNQLEWYFWILIIRIHRMRDHKQTETEKKEPLENNFIVLTFD
jgi:hypothetical protein